MLYQGGLTAEQKRKLRIIDNKSNESEWDIDLLTQELADLDFTGWNIAWDIPETESVEDVIEDEAPEVDEENEPISKRGTLYELGDHRLLCGDATDPADIERLMQGELADLLLTDPPYNVDYEGTAGKIQNDNMSDEAFREFLCQAFSQASDRIKAGAPFYVWHADSGGYNFRGALKDVGLKVRECLIWVKNSFVLGRQDYQWQHEPCLYGWKDGAAHFFRDIRTESTVIEDKPNLKKMRKEELLRLLEQIYSARVETTVIHEDKPLRNDLHPTMKPVKLLARLIINSTDFTGNKGVKPLVFDPFGGSGSTLIACEQLNRRCYMTELDPKFCDVIVKRWETFTGKTAKRIDL